MKYKLLSHTQGECFRELGDPESQDVCVDCAMLNEIVEQFYMDTARVEQIPKLRRWLLDREANPRLKDLVPAVMHFVRNMGFGALKAKRDSKKVWHVYLYMRGVRFHGEGPSFEQAYDEAMGGYLKLICGFEPKQKKEYGPSVYS